MTNELPAASTKPSDHRPSLRRYLVATAFLGAGTGLFTGISTSPVVGVLLPLLFGLLGGAGGLYVATLDLEQRAAQLKIRTLGTVVTTLMAALIPCAIYGVMLRTGAALASFVPHLDAGESDAPVITVVRDADPTVSLELILLRRRLDILGASRSEENAILEAAQRRASPFTKEAVVALLHRIRTVARQAADTLDRSANDVSGDSQQRTATDMFSLVSKMAAYYDFCADYVNSHPQVPLASLQQRLELDRDALSRLVHAHDGISWLSQHPPAQAAVWKLEMSLIAESLGTGSSWMSGSRFASGLDALVAARKGTPGELGASDAMPKPALAP